MGGTAYMVVVFVVLIAAVYFLMIRPNRKAQQTQQKLLDSIEVGSRVMTGSGIFGTVRHLGVKQVVIEVSPGCDMTVLRQAIRDVVKPEDDEFEYSDGVDDTGEPVGEAPDMSAYERDLGAAFGPTEAAAPAEAVSQDEPGESPEPAEPAEPADDHPDADTDQPKTADDK